MNSIIINQYLLFNDKIKKEIIEYLINNNLLVYSSIIDIKDVNLFLNDERSYSINDIEWIYDENNYRIPYLNNIKINVIKLSPTDNIYDFILCNHIIEHIQISNWFNASFPSLIACLSILV